MQPVQEGQKPQIFEYDEYRQYLGDLYTYMKKNKTGFSYRYFSRMAGFQSPNFLKLVIDGKRNLTADSSKRFANAFQLNKKESEFFGHLVEFNQTKNGNDREKLAARIYRTLHFRKAHSLGDAEFNYYSHWYMVAIREMVAMKGFKEDPQWIAKQMAPGITANQAKYALEQLLELGFLQRDASGQLRQKDLIVCTPNEVRSAFVAKFHREMMRMAGESIERFSREERDISSATVGVSHETAHRIKKMIQDFRQEILKVAGEDQSADRVYQVNFQLFPLVKVARSGVDEEAA